jgi:hypothetical protein
MVSSPRIVIDEGSVLGSHRGGIGGRMRAGVCLILRDLELRQIPVVLSAYMNRISNVLIQAPSSAQRPQKTALQKEL